MLGRTIAHFVVVEQVGEGGMGVVYKARDSHLDRFVALKVLPAARAGDADKFARFIQEAKAASALNHPHIVAIYDAGSDDGVPFIAMEYVEGKTLDRLIGRKGMDLRDALHYGAQIADALSKAHSAGIVHRDIKPSNIIVTGDRTVKVLDFGLAKLVEPTGPDNETATVRTTEGTIVGTAAYMSPEQAEGRFVDARSDVFSFGSLLYEMLTGQRAFPGGTRMSTLAAVAAADAPKPPSPLPREVERVVQRCLKKDPDKRWQTMADVKLALAELEEDSESGSLSGVSPTLVRRRRPMFALLLAAGALVIALSAGALAWRAVGRSREPPDLQPARLTFDSGHTAQAAVSPDGKLAAYASDRGGEGNTEIWVQQIGGRQPMRVTHNGADNSWPSFSPDGSRIAFRSERAGGGIYVIDTLGGEEQALAPGGQRPQFSPDGSQVAFVRIRPLSAAAKLFLVPSRGGEPREFQPEFDVGMIGGFAPGFTWSPDGRYILFEGVRGRDSETLDFWVAPVDGGPAVSTGAFKALPARGFVRLLSAWRGLYVYFLEGAMVESTDLYRVALAPGSWKIRGPAQQLTHSTLPYAAASVSLDGRVLLSSYQIGVDPWSVALDANSGKTTGNPQPVLTESALKASPACSRDGKWLAYVRWAGLRTQWRVEVHLRDLRTGREAVYPGTGAAIAMQPRVSPDGALLAYGDLSAGKWQSFFVPGPSAAPRKACDGCTILGFFSGGGQALASEPSGQLARLDLATGNRAPLVKCQPPVLDPDLSPDEKWVVFTTGSEIYAAPLAGTGTVAVARDDRLATSPRWSPDGKSIYFVSFADGHSCVWMRHLEPETRQPRGEPLPVLHSHAAPGYRELPLGMRTIAVSENRLFMTFGDVKGNIWTGKLQP